MTLFMKYVTVYEQSKISSYILYTMNDGGSITVQHISAVITQHLQFLRSHNWLTAVSSPPASSSRTISSYYLFRWILDFSKLEPPTLQELQIGFLWELRICFIQKLQQMIPWLSAVLQELSKPKHRLSQPLELKDES